MDIRLNELAFDHSRGTGAMWLFISTEAFLFVVLFFTYAYLGFENAFWPAAEAPPIRKALLMLLILLASSAVLFYAERRQKAGQRNRARIAVICTILLGLMFVGLQFLEFRQHLGELAPWTDAYGSIFYTITSIHGAHILLGLCMLAYVLILPAAGSGRESFARLHNAGLYWHFVDLIWIIIVLVLYLLPHLSGVNP